MIVYKNHVFFRKPTKEQKLKIDKKIKSFQKKKIYLKMLYNKMKKGLLTSDEVRAWREENEF